MAEGYIAEECTTFCSRYLDGIETVHNQRGRNDDGDNGEQRVGLSIFIVPGRGSGQSNNYRYLSLEERTLSHRWVVFNCEETSTLRR